jgi:hypothetical protein
MRHAFRSSILVLLLSAVATTTRSAVGQEPVAMNVPAPAFTGIDEWINAKPMAWKDLKGQVAVLHFWTFG